MKRRDLKGYLKERRLAQQLTQSEVAKKLSYNSSQYVSNWERGICTPPYEKLKQLIYLYRMRPSELLRFLLEEEKKHLMRCFGLKAIKK